MKNENLSVLLSKSWHLILLAGLVGYVIGTRVFHIGDASLVGLVIGLFAIGVIWTGLVVGFQTSRNTKR